MFRTSFGRFLSGVVFCPFSNYRYEHGMGGGIFCKDGVEFLILVVGFVGILLGLGYEVRGTEMHRPASFKDIDME